ncbi:MAG: FHA domain-containing protein [Verrucomicrobiota bacterium]
MPRFLGQSEEFQGVVYELNGSPLTLGRVEGNSLEIGHNSISGSHAELTFDQNDYVVRDLDSTNGTRVNGERVTEQKLRKGDVVRFGNIEFTYDSEYSPPAQALPEPSPRVNISGQPSRGRPEDFQNAAPMDISKTPKGSNTWTLVLALLFLLAVAGVGYFVYTLYLLP